MENKIFKITDDEFINLIRSSINISEVLFKLGYPIQGNSWGYSLIKERMLILHLSGKDFKGKNKALKSIKKLSNENLFTEHSRHSRTVIRKRIIRENLLEYKCSVCGLSEWNNKKLSLELDHINGINTDNRLENLRFLCPNCHSQTTTFGSKNTDIYSPIITLELKSFIENKYLEYKSIRKVCKECNLKPKIVKKIILDLGLTKSNQKYVIMDNSLRFGSISECCKYLINNSIVNTLSLKTCRNLVIHNKIENHKFEILDALRIINNL